MERMAPRDERIERISLHPLVDVAATPPQPPSQPSNGSAPSSQTTHDLDPLHPLKSKQTGVFHMPAIACAGSCGSPAPTLNAPLGGDAEGVVHEPFECSGIGQSVASQPLFAEPVVMPHLA